MLCGRPAVRGKGASSTRAKPLCVFFFKAGRSQALQRREWEGGALFLGEGAVRIRCICLKSAFHACLCFPPFLFPQPRKWKNRENFNWIYFWPFITKGSATIQHNFYRPNIEWKSSLQRSDNNSTWFSKQYYAISKWRKIVFLSSELVFILPRWEFLIFLFHPLLLTEWWAYYSLFGVGEFWFFVVDAKIPFFPPSFQRSPWGEAGGREGAKVRNGQVFFFRKASHPKPQTGPKALYFHAKDGVQTLWTFF